MEFSTRIPKERHFGRPARNNKSSKERYNYTKNITYTKFDYYSHAKLREFQRYGTLTVNKKEIVNAICNNNAVIIKQDETTVTALVRHSSRYYITVMDIDKKVIKTFLPENSCDFLHYVQKFIDKENSQKMLLAA